MDFTLSLMHRECCFSVPCCFVAKDEPSGLELTPTQLRRLLGYKEKEDDAKPGACLRFRAPITSTAPDTCTGGTGPLPCAAWSPPDQGVCASAASALRAVRVLCVCRRQGVRERRRVCAAGGGRHVPLRRHRAGTHVRRARPRQGDLQPRVPLRSGRERAARRGQRKTTLSDTVRCRVLAARNGAGTREARTRRGERVPGGQQAALRGRLLGGAGGGSPPCAVSLGGARRWRRRATRTGWTGAGGGWRASSTRCPPRAPRARRSSSSSAPPATASTAGARRAASSRRCGAAPACSSSLGAAPGGVGRL